MKSFLVVTLLAAACPAQGTALELPVQRSLADRLVMARRAADGGNPDRAIDEWQQLLDGRLDRVVAEAPTDSIHHGLRRVVIDAIESAGLRENYARRQESAATAVIVEGGEDGLLRCIDRFPLTAAARRAGHRLLGLWVESGRFEQACQLAHRLLRDGLIGTEDRTAIALARLAATRCGRDGTIFGDPTPLVVAGGTSSLAAFSARLAIPAAPVAEASRLDASYELVWSRRIGKNTDSGRRGRRFSSYDREDASPADDDYLPVRPLVVDGVVYACDGLSVAALSLENGRPNWPAVEGEAGTFYCQQRNLAVEYDVLVAGELVIAYLLGEPMLEGSRWSRSYIPKHHLVAIDRRTGVEVWNHANASTDAVDEDERFLAAVSITQPPLLRGDRLYAAGVVFQGLFQHWLCAFDRETGALVWRTFLGQGQTEMGRASTPRRSPVPARLGEFDGLLIAGSNQGTVAIADAVTGFLHGITAYESQNDEDFDPEVSSRRWSWSEFVPRWLPGPLVRVGTRVALAAGDRDEVLLVDLECGAVSFLDGSAATGESRLARLLGSADGRLLLADSQLRALPSAAETPWREETATLVGRIRGWPQSIGSQLVFATSGSQMILEVVPTATGLALDRRRVAMAQCAGHLILASPYAVTASAEGIHVFVGR